MIMLIVSLTLSLLNTPSRNVPRGRISFLASLSVDDRWTMLIKEITVPIISNADG